MATASPSLGRAARRLPRPRLRRPRITAARVGLLVVLVAILFGAWTWFRSSSLVAVHSVAVTGVSGRDASEITGTLAVTAKQMTTLDVSTTKLERAISHYGHIAGVSVATHFPHGVTVHVDQQLPVATINSGSRRVAVDAAGVLLPQDSTGGLPLLAVAPATDGGQVTTASTRAVLAVLAAAPYQLLSHIKSARMTSAHGVTVTLLDGPIIYFGASTQLPLKWRAADATLASSYSDGAAYINVSAPTRPAAGS